MNGTNQCSAPLDVDPRQRYFTTVQPFSYRDTLTVLGYIQEVASHIDELREQLDNLAKDEDADVAAIMKLVDGLDAGVRHIDETLDVLKRQVDQYENSALVYNPTCGEYEDSKNVVRDMYRELAVFGARVHQMAGMNCIEASAHSNLEFAVIGNKTIFGDPEPRITPKEEPSDEL